MPSSRPLDTFPYRMILPVVLVEIVFVAIPLINGFTMSLHHVDILTPKGFVFLDNYIKVLSEPNVLKALVATSIFTIGALFFTFITGFSLALFLERDGRFNVLCRATVLVPYVISMLVGSMLLKWIFAKDSGLLSFGLAGLGFEDVSILASPQGAMAALIFNGIWRDSAFAMILLMAGLKSVPLNLYAAARVDGAGAIYRFVRITLPLMRIPILITLVRLMIHFVNVLTFSLVLTGGGPFGSTTTIGLELYFLGFKEFRFGEANALAILMFLFNIAAVFILVKLFQERRGAQA